MHITHWSSEDLARQAVKDQIVDRISPRTIRRILNDVDLQPHRTRYWKTARIDPLFKARAEKILWCYSQAARLAEKGIAVICVDEVPNFQIKERRPIRRAVPGHIEQQEFDYTRHGTASLLFFLVVATGKMELRVQGQKNAAEFIEALQDYRHRHSQWQGAYLIYDGDSSHTARAAQDYLVQDGWWRPRRTPVNASWLDQAEILINMFGSRYLKRTSWSSREEFLGHLSVSWPEYNERYAHPIEWTWTSAKMRSWYEKHSS